MPWYLFIGLALCISHPVTLGALIGTAIFIVAWMVPLLIVLCLIQGCLDWRDEHRQASE